VGGPSTRPSTKYVYNARKWGVALDLYPWRHISIGRKRRADWLRWESEETNTTSRRAYFCEAPHAAQALLAEPGVPSTYPKKEPCFDSKVPYLPSLQRVDVQESSVLRNNSDDFCRIILAKVQAMQTVGIPVRTPQ